LRLTAFATGLSWSELQQELFWGVAIFREFRENTAEVCKRRGNKMLLSINDFYFIFELIEAEEAMLNFLRNARAKKVAQIDIGRGAVLKFLDDLGRIDQSKLNNKMRKRLAILLEELEEARDTMPDEKHPTMQALEEELKNRQFSSEAELREFMNARNAGFNERPQPDLGNLTPSQLHRLFSLGWWDAGGPVKLSTDITEAEAETVPIVNNVRLMLRSILARSGPKGLKATTTGNLPRSVVNDVAQGLMDPLGRDISELKRGKKAINEDDLHCLCVQRHIAWVAGLIDLIDDYWQVTPPGQSLLRPGAAAELLATLFATTYKNFDLAFLDGYPIDNSLQHTLPYSLWRVANLVSGAEYTTSELAAIVLHPETLRNGAQPAFENSPGTLAERIADSRLFRTLVWLGCLEYVNEVRFFDEKYRVTGLAAKIFRTPDFPKP